jgi:pheromone alpha factor receptor
MPSPNPKNITWATIVENQTFNVTDIYGHVRTLSLNDLNAVMHSVGRSLIIFGVNIGMCFTVAVVVLLLTKTEKRRTPIFILNMAGLSFQFIRMLMVAIFYNGPDYNFQPYLLGDTVLIPSSAFAPFDIDFIAGMFWYTVIVTSLILQVLVVFGAERKVRRYLKYSLGLLGLATIAFNITAQADALKVTFSKTGEYAKWFPWLYKTGRILYTITVGVTSGIFVAKLLFLIRRRKKMGFKGFGPLQVIVIMGAQCLLVPRTLLSIKLF